MGGMMGGFGFGSLGWIGMILNLVITIGVIVGVVLLIVWLVRRASGDSVGRSLLERSAGVQSSPKEILQLRYAQGEINSQQYQEMLSDLN
jgi:putative membrane protein